MEMLTDRIVLIVDCLLDYEMYQIKSVRSELRVCESLAASTCIEVYKMYGIVGQYEASHSKNQINKVL